MNKKGVESVVCLEDTDCIKASESELASGVVAGCRGKVGLDELRMEWNCNWRVWEERDWTFNETAWPVSCKISQKLGEAGIERNNTRSDSRGLLR